MTNTRLTTDWNAEPNAPEVQLIVAWQSGVFPAIFVYT
jgi:hypothetical protein